MSESAYQRAGVSIDAGGRAVDLMRAAVRSTYGAQVLAGIGSFGGLYDASQLQAMSTPVLVASTDGVGTKTMVASALDSYETIGQDIVNHCVNDILVQGAEPLFFLDYIAMSVLNPEIVARVVTGAADACRAAGCALLGGETAEMPGVYLPGELDLVGTIVGVVDRASIVDGSTIEPGDILLGLPSSGLHTNGFSLVRSIFPPTSYGDYAELLGRPLGQALVEPHRSYLPAVRALRQVAPLKGLAHITGGGFIENTPRILPEGLTAMVRRDAWEAPPLFGLIQRVGQVDPEEMYRVFNMGIGMIAVAAPEHAEQLLAAVPEASLIGSIQPQQGAKRVILA